MTLSKINRNALDQDLQEDRNANCAELARKHHVSRQYVYQRKMRLGLPTNKQVRHKKLEALKKLYKNMPTLTDRQLAERFDLPVSVVRNGGGVLSSHKRAAIRRGNVNAVLRDRTLTIPEVVERTGEPERFVKRCMEQLGVKLPRSNRKPHK
jgi:hypothetical protein